jgi:hypothetical protein
MNDKIMKAFAKMLEKTMNPMPNHCVECDKPTQETLCSECMAKEDEPEGPEAQRPIDDDLVSNCCTAQFTYPGWPDSDICSKCHEHADTAISNEIFGDNDGKS